MTDQIIKLDTLDRLLEQERALLLEGDLQGLGKLLPQKEAIIEDLLNESLLSRDAVAPIERKLQRNQLLLDGALDGIRAVAARLAALRQVRSALDTYDAQGRRQTVGGVGPLHIGLGGFHILHMHDQRVKAGPAFGGIDARHSLPIARIRPQPIDRFSGKGDLGPVGQQGGGTGKTCCIRVQMEGFGLVHVIRA